MGVRVETSCGTVDGVQEQGWQRFRGIPFAAPPIGAQRFRAPVAPEPWSGARAAHEYGPSAPQNPSPLPGMAVGEQSEDCLYLNVYTPAADSGRRPVLVWIHGGGFTGGSGSQALYDGGRLAARGDVVVVTVNYRLGALGYLCAEGVESNLGQLDQIAALEWVQGNVAAFGGDPSCVTLFGESAGGMAVATLLAMPAARGLFRRAIPQSGAAHHTHTPASAALVLETLLDELGETDLGKLRDVSVEALLAAQQRLQLRLAGKLAGLPFAPVVDGASLPRHPLEAVQGGSASEVDLLVGTTRDEVKLFRMMERDHASLDDAGLHKRARAALRLVGQPEAAPRIVETYREARAGVAPTEPFELYDAIDTDRMFRVPAIRLAEAKGEGAFAYLFCWASPARRGALGACHAIELPFVFGTLDAPGMDRFAGAGAEAERLAERTMDAWLAFARSGSPATDALPGWAPYDAARRATMLLDREPDLVDRPLDAERAAWDGIL